MGIMVACVRCVHTLLRLTDHSGKINSVITDMFESVVGGIITELCDNSREMETIFTFSQSKTKFFSHYLDRGIVGQL